MINKGINKEYWDLFYTNNKVASERSSFADYTLEFLKKNKISGHLIDIACGNGRDSTFFSQNKIKTTGIDISINLENTNFDFISDDLLTHDFNLYDILYLRFVVHTLTEKELDIIINKIRKIKDIYIFIETRSTKEITNEVKSETFFRSSIGEKHFRMLYSKEYLDNKFSMFDILESSEGRYSKFGDDDPFCIRYILKN